MPSPKRGDIWLIDFGMAAFVESFVLKQHIVGTPKYVSIRVHEGSEYSYRDDLISLAYIALGLATGSFEHLWGPIPTVSSTEYKKTDILHPVNTYLREMKSIINIVCRLKDCPELGKYIEAVYSLEQNESPNYEMLRDLCVCKK